MTTAALLYDSPSYSPTPVWQGYTEFAPIDGTTYQPGDNASQRDTTPIALRVLPAHERTVVFDGPLLHRATVPSPQADAALQERGNHRNQSAGHSDSQNRLRHSTVMQVLCVVNRALAAAD